ncbi:Unknown protein [Striga hermonthica]|uniref:F-box domain-containing protein n=1 Tax=Striga hermonthica TaxID=68872 RepID=A0A9N7MN00_STRHE|nr:Unknown protein [Striga hermonthica]
MGQESIIQHLPQEITINILSRLPIKTIITCKLVCKSWLELLETREFVDFHLSKSLPGLIVFKTTRSSKILEFFELNDEPNLEHHNVHYNPVTEFDHDLFLSRSTCIQGSANGLLFLREVNAQPNVLHICNPITREFIELESQEKFVYSYPTIVTYGFGVSRTTGQYKVVRVFHECTRDDNTNELLGIPKSECHVYTLGTRSWRKIAHDHAKLEYSCRSTGAFSNGNLHWRRWLGDLYVLSGCLCICDNASEDEIVIWLMREYGDDKSWTKEYVISKRPDFAGECYEVVRPMKVFGDGDVLMAWDDYFLFYYSERDKVVRSIDMFGSFGSIDSFLHKPSFFSLTNFPMENAVSF